MNDFIESPWISSMSKSSSYAPTGGSSDILPTYDANPPTVAAFSPTSSSGYNATSKQRSTVIVHKKSPLLFATPPQITRALAHSHPFLLPLNKLVGILSWSTADPWESFLLLAGFWGVVLYGDEFIRFASPLMVVIMVILGMYSRRYSPLSSASKTGEKQGHKREPSDISGSSHHKSLDEIIDTMQEFTARCNILLGPFLGLTDFLSTQRTPTSATTRPALTTLFIRILLVTPIWILLTLPPFYILTPRRVILAVGTIILTWHSQPARVSRVILWRSVFIRRVCSFATGLQFGMTGDSNTESLIGPPLSPRKKSQINLASEIATKKNQNSSGVRFTFIVYENQRRWIGLGWTSSLFAYERPPWTDENLHPAPSKEEFQLPEVEGRLARWKWVDKSEWKIDFGDVKQQPRSENQSKGGMNVKDTADDGGGWIYYDNRWNDGKKSDGWGRYTRRRKWYRDAELVEVTPSTEITPSGSPEVSDTEETKIRKAREYAKGVSSPVSPSKSETTPTMAVGDFEKEDDSNSMKARKRNGWFSKRERSDSKSSKNTAHFSSTSDRSRDGPEDDVVDKWRENNGGHRGFSVQEDVAMSLG